MARRILGLDIGNRAVRGVLLETLYRGFTVVDHAEVPVSGPGEDVEPGGAERPPRDRQADAVRAMIAERGWSFDQAVVALPGASSASHLVSLPFTDPRRIEQTVAFEVESQIPFDLAEVAWDWQLLGVRAGRSDLLVAVVRKEELAGLLAALAGAGVDPRAVLPPGAALASLQVPGVLAGDEPLGAGAVDVVLDVGDGRTGAAVVSAGGLEWARSFGLGAQDLARGTPGLLRELRATLKAFRARAGEPRAVRRVLLAGDGAGDARLAEALAAEVGAPAAPLALAGAAAERIPEADQPRFALALALALHGHLAGRAPRLNLRRGELAYTRDFQHLRGKVVRLAAWAGVVVALALVSAGVKAFALSRQERLLDRALCDATQKIVGKCYEDYDQAESVLRGRGTPAAAIPKMSAYDVFVELAARSPADVPLRYDRVEISRDKLHLQGTTDSAENVDRIVSALRGSRCFGDARSGNVRRRTGADAKFEFAIDSDLTCETGAGAGGRSTP
jgi:general secretion pathway protein L